MVTTEVKTIKPNNLPFKCPVCNGFGSLQYGKRVCHACGGTGIVHVPQIVEEDDNGK